MKRRIFLYNTVVVLLALAALLLISSEVVRRVGGDYAGKPPPEDPPNVAVVQELLENWDNGDGWTELDQRLEGLGYQLQVSRSGAEVFSTLSTVQREMLPQGDALAWPEGEAADVWNGRALLVGIRMGEYTVIAMGRPEIPEVLGRQRPQAEAALLSLLIIGAAAIVLIVALSMVSTHFQVRHIMRPVNALADAARRVEAGDYTQPVSYNGKDEFASVCAAFEQMQRHLLEEREKIAAYERSRADLVAGISHDLRTPLTSVQGYLKGLRDGVANTEEKKARYLDIAYRKAHDMERLLQRLFDFSRLESGSLPLSPVRTDLGEFAREYVGCTAAELAEKGGRFVLRGAPAPHPVRMDRVQMKRVLDNLTENALCYAGAEELALTLTVWRGQDMEKLRFADNGRGVPEEHLPHLFEQFWRGDRSRSGKNGEGSGLGLYIAKYIVEAQGGTVAAWNDGGLVIELALPCEEELYAQHFDRGG